MVVPARKQPHRFGRRGSINDTSFMYVSFQFSQQGLRHDAGRVVFKRHKDSFADQILWRNNHAAFANQLRDAAGQNIDHANLLPLIAQAYTDIARVHHYFKLFIRYTRVRLTGRMPNLE